MVTLEQRTTPAAGVLDRRDVVGSLLSRRGESLVVTGLGSPSYDVHAAGDDDRNYYLWGAMGAAALTGLGLAQARPKDRVVVITGDGEQLMAFGALATIGVAQPDNLVIIVIDNGHFGETGMQLSHAGAGLDLAAVAASCGFSRTSVITDMADVERLDVSDARSLDGPELHVVKVVAENKPRSLPSRDAVYNKNRFRRAIGLGEP